MVSASVNGAPGNAGRGRRAWLLFFGLGVLAAIAAPFLLVGNAPDPPSPEGFTGLSAAAIATRIPGMAGYISSISTQLGNFMLTSGVLMAAIAIGPFRRGERWAWYALWVVPLLLLIQFLNSRGGLGWQFDLGLLFVMIGGLLWPFRLFFPKRVGQEGASSLPN
ncbi:MAG: hypothetical protein A2Z32_00550 [Chloroflexi bacterium RBG_16_69_14]|nr:MAG: hypothetical protein A2Z32_00550 [Chloroflexi bacterium RBG_16_69_14]